jgi:hypothetical protein
MKRARDIASFLTLSLETIRSNFTDEDELVLACGSTTTTHMVARMLSSRRASDADDQPLAACTGGRRRRRAAGSVYGRRSVVLARVYGRVRGDADGLIYVLVIDDLGQQLEWRAC